MKIMGMFLYIIIFVRRPFFTAEIYRCFRNDSKSISTQRMQNGGRGVIPFCKRWSWFLGQETGIYKWETALD